MSGPPHELVGRPISELIRIFTQQNSLVLSNYIQLSDKVSI